ncbi:MAG: methionine biosynthesis protein MetW [Alphaproteobacteria bacterium]|nr:methionine biosynthesis protein MetW [Alphaproteobacteria bacterium]
MGIELRLIAEMVAAESRILDIGCGDGELLKYLTAHKRVDGRGIELDPAQVARAVAHGLSVIQGDADTDLKDFPDRAFDYVILSQTLPALRRPREVLEHLLRIGRHAIVSIPNLAYWRLRWRLMTRGRVPMTRVFRDPWYSTPIIHPCSIEDFLSLCGDLGIRVERSEVLTRDGRQSRFAASGAWANLFGELAVFLLARR